VKYRRRFVVRGEDWFEAALPAPGVDVHEVFHVGAPIPGYRCVEFFTLLFDLRATADELFAAVRPEARRQIRRCTESAEIVYDHFFPCGPDPLERFFAAYDELAAIKGLAALDHELVQLYAENGTLDLSLVRKTDGSVLAWHANYRTPERARQLHSIAFFRGDKAERNLVGRAHRYHTWMDILRFKESGTPVFDLGGWYHGTADEELLKINAFKEEFGGRVVCQFICERGVSVRGKAYIAIRNLTGKGAFNAVAGATP
jgi:hypothetical protein